MAVDTAAETHARHNFVRNLVTKAGNKAGPTAKHFLDSAKSYKFVKAGLEKAEEFSKPLVSQYGNKVETLLSTQGDRLITILDNGIHTAVEKVKPQVDRFVLPAYAAAKDRFQSSNLQEAFVQAYHKSTQNITDSKVLAPIYSSAVDAYMSLDRDEQGRISPTLFVEKLKLKLGAAWDDKFAKPAEHFYGIAAEELAKRGVTSREDVSNMMSAKLDGARKSAENFYNSAVDVWVKLHVDLNGKLPPSLFVSAMQQRMGALWTDRLTPAAEAFFALAKEELHNAKDDNGHLSLSTLSCTIRQRVVCPLLDIAERAVDQYLPDHQPAQADMDKEDAEEQQEPVGKRIRRLPGNVSKRIQQRAMSKLTQLKQLSDDRLASMVHIDLIAYAAGRIDVTKQLAQLESGFNSAKQAVRSSLDSNVIVPVRSSIQRALPKALQKADGSALTRDELRALLRDKLNQLSIRIYQPILSLDMPPLFHAFVASLPTDRNQVKNQISSYSASAKLIVSSSVLQFKSLAVNYVATHPRLHEPVAVFDRVSKRLVVFACSEDAKLLVQNLREALIRFKPDQLSVVLFQGFSALKRLLNEETVVAAHQ
eukprot:GILK01003997.1.p1 GENE.GILK01003997.1~~GILK01003997.1.p1  ORF type:complete len:593 (+),score=129.82 GILK01003997.1:98-1876(+)